jgi:xylose isomerase
MPPLEIVSLLGEIGAWDVNLHDNDLVSIDASPAERDRIVREFRKACEESGIVVPWRPSPYFFTRFFGTEHLPPTMPK